MLQRYSNAEEKLFSHPYEFMAVLMSLSVLERRSGYFQYIHCSIHPSLGAQPAHLGNGIVMMEICSQPREREREPETGDGTDLISEAGPGHTDNGIRQLAHLVSFLFINLFLSN